MVKRCFERVKLYLAVKSPVSTFYYDCLFRYCSFTAMYPGNLACRAKSPFLKTSGKKYSQQVFITANAIGRTNMKKSALLQQFARW